MLPGLVCMLKLSAVLLLQVAERHASAFCREQLGYKHSNMRYVNGHIEFLDKAGIKDNSVDIIISNCVVNLSPDKQRVLSEAYRVLAPGGEMYFSDVYSDRRMPKEAQEHEVSLHSMPVSQTSGHIWTLWTFPCPAAECPYIRLQILPLLLFSPFCPCYVQVPAASTHAGKCLCNHCC